MSAGVSSAGSSQCAEAAIRTLPTAPSPVTTHYPGISHMSEGSQRDPRGMGHVRTFSD